MRHFTIARFWPAEHVWNTIPPSAGNLAKAILLATCSSPCCMSFLTNSCRVWMPPAQVTGRNMGEDACRIAHPKNARNMVTLRNLAIGLYNRLRVEEKTQAPSLPSWRRSMKLSAALRHILR